MSGKMIISEKEFDELKPYEQINYRFCIGYNLYYLNEINSKCNPMIVKTDKCCECERYKED